jgi:hypothetical protein
MRTPVPKRKQKAPRHLGELVAGAAIVADIEVMGALHISHQAVVTPHTVALALAISDQIDAGRDIGRFLHARSFSLKDLGI